MPKRVLTDEQYVRFKETGNDNGLNGNKYEHLIIHWMILRLASLQIRHSVDLSSVVVEHHPRGQFVDDVLISRENLKFYIHAKSGTTLSWDANLERDFRQQPLYVPEGTFFSMSLYVRSEEKRSEMISERPSDLPKMQIYVLDSNWMTSRKDEIPRVRRHLRQLNNDFGEAALGAIWRQLSRAWDSLADVSFEARGATAASLNDVLRTAHAASGGSIKGDYAPPPGEDDYIFLVANQLRRIPHLWVAQEDNSLKWRYALSQGRIWLGVGSDRWRELYDHLSAMTREELTIDYFLEEF